MNNHPKKILIIEDNVTFRKMMQMRLKSEGYETITAEDGLTGLNIARQKKPDLIILDLMLPVLDGHKVCRMLKFDKQNSHIPVLIFTSRDMDEDAEMANNCGADAFVIKTTRSAIVMEVIKKLLAKKDKQNSG